MKKALLALVVSAAVVGVAVVGYVVFLVLAARGPGWFHRDRLEAVVAEVRRSPLPANEVVELYLGEISDPRSLRPLERPIVIGNGAGHVWAERTEDGHLKVVIETTDGGHAGEYGFAFSDVPLEPMQSGSELYIDVPGRLRFVEGPGSRIDEHWWKVHDDSF